MRSRLPCAAGCRVCAADRACERWFVACELLFVSLLSMLVLTELVVPYRIPLPSPPRLFPPDGGGGYVSGAFGT